MPRFFRSLLAIGLSLAALSAAIAWQNSDVKTQPAEAKVAPLQTGPTYWKGNLHTHSLWSDGDDFPEMIADWYKRHGYHFLTLSDHNILSEGQKWIDVAPGRRRTALRNMRLVSATHWVERRKRRRTTKSSRSASNLWRVSHPARRARPIPAHPGRRNHAIGSPRPRCT